MASTSSGSFDDSPASTAPSETSSETETAGATGAAHAPEKSPDDTSKLRMFLGILRK